jgi:hypothetical protein
MRMLIYFVVLLMVIGLAGTIQLGGSTEKTIILGSLSKNVLNQSYASNETNTTNQTNITNQSTTSIAIKSPMSIIPVSNKFKSVDSPNSISANSITYQFTT